MRVLPRANATAPTSGPGARQDLHEGCSRGSGDETRARGTAPSPVRAATAAPGRCPCAQRRRPPDLAGPAGRPAPRHLGDRCPQPPVGRARPATRRDPHQQPAEERQQDAEHDTADEQQSGSGIAAPTSGGSSRHSKVSQRAAKSAPSQAAPTRAASSSSHCSTRTRPAHTGIREAPRSVAPSASSSRSLRSCVAGQGRLADGVRPRSRQVAGHVVGDARTAVSTRARCTCVGCGHARCGRRPVSSPAGRAEVEVQPLERVGPEPGEPRRDRPAGGAAGADPGRGRSTASTTVGTPAASANASSRAATRSLPSVRRGVPSRWRRRSAGPRRARRPQPRPDRPSWPRPGRRSPRAARRCPRRVRALVAMTGTPPRPSASSSRRTSASIDCGGPAGRRRCG